MQSEERDPVNLKDDPKRRQPDISEARRLLGWESVPLEEGLRLTPDYF